MGILLDFWRELDGPVHPKDRPILDALGDRQPFNLDFPPPAYFGAIDVAPVIVLYNNGGFDEIGTPLEFPTQEYVFEYISALKSGAPCDPGRFSPYYASNYLRNFIKDGRVAWVNAIAYRSKNTKNPIIRNLLSQLPSAKIAKEWLEKDLIPAAAAGKRMIVFHRFSLWGYTKIRIQKELNYPCVVFSKVSNTPHVSEEIRSEIEYFLYTR